MLDFLRSDLRLRRAHALVCLVGCLSPGVLSCSSTSRESGRGTSLRPVDAGGTASDFSLGPKSSVDVSTVRDGAVSSGPIADSGSLGAVGGPDGRDSSVVVDDATGGDADRQACAAGKTRLCSEAGLLGACASGYQHCVGGKWNECDVSPVSQDTCLPGDDASCNGIPNEGCACVEGATQKCSVSGALGNCAEGKQVCTADGTFGACSVEPASVDSCTIAGDDADCDGVPSGDCPCESGTAIECGPSSDRGVCVFGRSLCVDSSQMPCEAAVLAGSRDCSSSGDNDCDGFADNLIDDTCQCVAGETRLCDEHPRYDGNGSCSAGIETCIIASDSSRTIWGACVGAVAPASSDSCQVAGDDSDCDGEPNSDCGCVAGEESTCAERHGSLGVCGSTILVCSATGRWPSATNCSPSGPERCDDDELDDDCDGACGCRDAVWGGWLWGEQVCWQ